MQNYRLLPQNYLQQGMPDATSTAGDRRVVFSPNSVSAAGNKRNWN